MEIIGDSLLRIDPGSVVHCTLYTVQYSIEEGFIQMRRQRSSLLFGGRTVQYLNAALSIYSRSNYDLKKSY